MRILTGALITETNTFSPIPTGWTAFERTPVQRGAQAPFEAAWEFAPLVRWRELAEGDGHTVIESVAAVAEPGGRNVREAMPLKEYPHTDMVERAGDVYRICVEASGGKTKPVMAMHECGMVGLWPTSASPMREFVDEAMAAERDGVLSVSLMHGFPWADVAGCGAKVIAIADGDRALAEATARRFGEKFWDVRERAHVQSETMDAAIDLALLAPDGLVVLADVLAKSTHHFWTGFSPIAKRAIYVNAPGALQLDFANIAYETRELDYWPRTGGIA